MPSGSRFANHRVVDDADTQLPERHGVSNAFEFCVGKRISGSYDCPLFPPSEATRITNIRSSSNQNRTLPELRSTPSEPPPVTAGLNTMIVVSRPRIVSLPTTVTFLGVLPRVWQRG